jgi:hypothetical protein
MHTKWSKRIMLKVWKDTIKDGSYKKKSEKIVSML